MGGAEVGNWVSAYLDKNLDLLLRLTSAGGLNITEEEEEVGMNLSWDKEEVVEDPLIEMEEEMVVNVEVEVKLETDPVQNLDADLGTVSFQSNLQTNFGKETKTESGVTEKKKKKFSLRDDPLRLVCGWWFCGQEFPEWSPFHEHVMISHLKEVRDGLDGGGSSLACHWQGCQLSHQRFIDHRRHLNIHCYQAKLTCHGAALLSRNPSLTPCRVQPLPLPPHKPMTCGWKGCDEGIADSVDGLVDTAGAPVQLLHDRLQWIQPLDFYIHVSSHAYEENGKWVGCAWIDCCDNKLRFPSKLREHLRLHTGEKAVACPSCGNNFATRAKATAHFLRKGLAPSDGNFPCEECGKDFNSAQLVRDHVRVHLRNHQCDQCSIAMPTPSTLRTHIRYVHLKERLQSCTLCNYKGKTTADIRSHMKTHDRNRAKVICKYHCGFSKMSKKAVQVHYENRHGHARNVFGCHKCDEANFSEGTQVTKHLQRAHGLPKAGLVRQQFKKGINGIFYMSQEDV